MDNTELIKKYEEVSTEQLQLLKEIFTRYQNGELSQSEFGQIQEIASKQGAYLFDNFTKGYDKMEIKKAISSAIDMCTDENR